MNTLLGKKYRRANPGDFHKNPFFYFGLFSFVLLGVLFSGSQSLAQLDGGGLIVLNAISSNGSGENGDAYVTQNSAKTLETPDLKTSQEAFLYGVATPHVVSAQTLGDIMGGVNQAQNRNEVIDYVVEVGDTPASVAASFGISLNTLLWANDLSKNATLKTDQTLVILPFDGVLHIVKSGDTIESIAKMYKASQEDIISDNGFADGNIFDGDIAMVRGGIVAPKVSIIASIGSQNVLPDSFFIFPLLRFKITQGLHYYNAVDISSLDGVGSPVYAAAGGVVQHAEYDRIGGNRVTIAHPNGVITYYGHLASIMVVPGSEVRQGQEIGTEGQTGKATGPHVHFQVMGASNFIAKYKRGSVIDVTKK